MIQFQKQHINTINVASTRIMSYNVRLFDLYNWKNSESLSTRNSIFKLINQQSPDILCLQEYYSGGKIADFADTISRHNKYLYRYISLLDQQKNRLPYGLATFSRYPIAKATVLKFSNSSVNFCQVVDVVIGPDTVRVMNLHLESIKFGKEDYNFVSELSSSISDNNKISRGSRAIFSKMKSAYIRRAVQAETVADAIKKSPYPVLLTGDFNDTSVSYSYKIIATNMNDAFVEAGYGIGQTYSQFLPFLRIDYVFTSTDLNISKFTTIRESYSDHYPIVAEINLHL